MKLLSYEQDLTIGCDPEFFITRNGRVIGSENILPHEGLPVGVSGKFIIDGVQCEMNPRAETCRGTLGNNIQDCFKGLVKHIDDNFKGQGISINLATTIKIRKSNFDKLSNNCKRFGCMMSKNITQDGEVRHSTIEVDPMEYRSRSGGGHFHMSFTEWSSRHEKGLALLHTPAIIVPILDIIVGNTCVMVDRDRGNKERRQTYGRAGEYRTPIYGLEYRTLSNFWLRSPYLFSLAAGLVRWAVQMAVESDQEHNYIKELRAMVDMKDIHKAINNNDVRLARRNFNRISDFLMEITPEGAEGFYPITYSTIEQFIRFTEDLPHKDTGIKLDDPIKEWVKMSDAHDKGINSFLLEY